MSGPYLLLYTYLDTRFADTVVLTFAQIEDVLGFALPAQARLQAAWWTADADGRRRPAPFASRGRSPGGTRCRTSPRRSSRSRAPSERASDALHSHPPGPLLCAIQNMPGGGNRVTIEV